MNKTCTKCGETKPTTEFHKKSDTRDGLHSYCKSCRKASDKAYYEANKEKIKARDKAYREANKEKIKAYREANKEKIKARQRAYREASPEKVKAYYEANREERKAWQRAYRETPAGKFSQYRRRAKIRNIPFLIEFQQFEDLWQKPCYYCGAEIKTIGLDRVDNDGPYHIDNVVPCCAPCNQSKFTSTLEEWSERKNDREKKTEVPCNA